MKKVSGNKNISVDVRIIITTNKDLASEVLMKHFRDDLFTD
ncbi:MAG: sigma 54-interacting transcriptional regulator [Ignavibacteria bacterium]|nr:sigma 54-interacting transcriptional regulator [Ignavibacteria bacterium]